MIVVVGLFLLVKVLSSLISKVVGQDIIGRFKKDGGVGWVALHVTATKGKGAVREGAV
jgi:hypothetical protein